jgi:FlaA1/EpsC-like NDP-sugar epimerase
MGASVDTEAQIADANQSAEDQGVWSAPALRIALLFSERRVLLVVVDTLLVNGAVLAAVCLWAWVSRHTLGPDFVRAWWFWFPVLIMLWWFLGCPGDLDDVFIASSWLKITQRVRIVGLSLLLVCLAACFLMLRDAVPRLFFLFFVGIALTSVLLWRWAYVAIFTLPPFRHRMLIAGAGRAGRTMAQALSFRIARRSV